MRISELEKNAFISVLSRYLKGNAELRLFGSRVDDTAKGGDIDLLLIVEDKAHKYHLNFNKPEILSEIKSIIGEEKIDLIYASLSETTQDIFIKNIIPSSVLLHEFKL